MESVSGNYPVRGSSVPFPACGTHPMKKILKIIRVIIIFIVIYIFDIYIVFYIFYITAVRLIVLSSRTTNCN